LGLQGQHVLLTGASGGIGVKTALLFLKAGAKVSLHYNTEKSTLEPLVKEYPDTTFIVQGDVRKEEQVSKIIENCVQKFGIINSLILNHAIFVSKDVPITDMSLDQFKKHFRCEFSGLLFYLQENF